MEFQSYNNTERIYKKVLSIEENGTLIAPIHSKVIKVGEQDDYLVAWFKFETRLCDDAAPISYKIVGTGDDYDVDDDFRYFDTVIMSNGLVWHVFFKKDD